MMQEDDRNLLIRKIVGRRIHECRLDQEMTDKEFAQKLNYKNTSVVHKIESGKIKLEMTRLFQIADILNTNVSYLLGENNSPNLNKNPFELETISIRVNREAPMLSECQLDSPEAAIRVLGEMLSEMDREMVSVINLNGGLRPINASIISVGTLTESIAHPREVIKCAILSNAAGIILLHNHPSSRSHDLQPSTDDCKITDRFNEVCKLVGMELYDHIIIGKDKDAFFSFKEHGLIQNKVGRMFLTKQEEIHIGLDIENVAENNIICRPKSR